MSGTITTTIASLPAAQQYAIAYISGLDLNGQQIGNSYGSLTKESTSLSDPATYSGTGSAKKWGTATSFTSATVTYSYDTGSNWTTDEKRTFAAALQLWSNIANISFTEVTPTSSPQEVFYRFGSSTWPTGEGPQPEGALHSASSTSPVTPAGSTTTGSFISGYITLDTTQFPGVGDISVNAGYGVGTVVHEVGHLIGLGHAGPYNGAVKEAFQQLNEYDNNNFTLMSYIDPSTTTAQFFNNYTVKGTNYANLALGPHTAMPNDILAAQTLYGAATTGAFTQSQTFGFNTTIADATALFYDFTRNKAPVVTFYSTATTNTLDLSGFSTASTVDLNPGTWSSAAGMVNNLAIAYGTQITSFVGGAADDTVTVNALSNTINGGGGSNTVVFSQNRSAWQLSSNGVSVTATNGSISNTLVNVSSLKFNDQTVAASSIPCFREGTRIATARGDIPVEHLRPGDLACTAAGALRPIVWIGHRRVDARTHPRPHDVAPIRIAAHAFAQGAPARDLLVSPDHAIATDGHLIPARYLVNGATIAQQPPGRLRYFHVELETHDILLAENLPAESFLDTGNRGAFANGGPIVMATPDFALRIWEAASCAPLCTHGAVLEAARSWLAVRAEALGHRTTTEPALTLHTQAGPLAPAWTEGGSLGYVLPPGTTSVRLLSRRFRVEDHAGPGADTRPLGIALSALAIDNRPIPLDDPRLTTGWHPPESTLRWTSGTAEITCPNACTIELTLLPLGRYWHQAA